MTVPGRASATIDYTDHSGTDVTVSLHWPLELAAREELRSGIRKARFSVTSLDRQNTETTRIEPGADEAVVRIRYHGDEAELKKLIEHAADGVSLTYNRDGTAYPVEMSPAQRSEPQLVRGDRDEWWNTRWEADLRIRRTDGGSLNGMLP